MKSIPQPHAYAGQQLNHWHKHPNNPKLFLQSKVLLTGTASSKKTVLHQENNALLEWLEPVSPVIPAHHHINWI